MCRMNEAIKLLSFIFLTLNYAYQISKIGLKKNSPDFVSVFHKIGFMWNRNRSIYIAMCTKFKAGIPKIRDGLPYRNIKFSTSPSVPIPKFLRFPFPFFLNTAWTMFSGYILCSWPKWPQFSTLTFDDIDLACDHEVKCPRRFPCRFNICVMVLCPSNPTIPYKILHFTVLLRHQSSPAKMLQDVQKDHAPDYRDKMLQDVQKDHAPDYRMPL